MLRGAGHHVRILTRNRREPAPGIEYRSCDLLGGAGLYEALKGVETVLHLAGGPKGDDEATRNLVSAARSDGVRHLVYPRDVRPRRTRHRLLPPLPGRPRTR
ncbi:NAD(P)H-binding protein [Streptomyces sp. NPDC052496]|uniref:SDR family oxidoreductase n=1 Tax=Streptomyces sp. NPDC052496 TaxID=3154951 RepID=UPI003433ED57